MSRTWKRSGGVGIYCGSCGRPVLRHQPYLELRIAGAVFSLSEPKRRCEECAGLKAPADLPHLAEPVPVPATTLTRFSKNMLPLDFKKKASGDK